MAEEKQENKKIQEKNINFFKKVIYSITKFERYPEMAAEGLSSAFKYLALIMLIFSTIVAGGFLYKLQDVAKKGIDYFRIELPDITYNNGILDVHSDEAITIDTGNLFVNKIIIDTKSKEEEQKYVDSISDDNTGIVILKDKIIIKARGMKEETTYKYPEIISSLTNQEINSITKQDILNYVTGSGMISLYVIFFILMIIYIFIIYSISVLVDTLLIAILGNITILFTKLKLKFSAVYSMSIYALTLSILLNAIYIVVNSITGFEMKYFQIMYTSIAYICLVAALFMIRLDFIKKQAEIMKMIEEQEKIRQEMNEKDEEKNEKPEDDEKKDEEKDEEESNKEPDGSEA